MALQLLVPPVKVGANKIGSCILLLRSIILSFCFFPHILRNGYIPNPVVISNIIGKNDISNIKESDWEIISDDIGNDYIPNPVVISNITVEAAALCKTSPNSHTQPNPTPTRKSSYGAGCFTQGTTCIINPLTAT